MSIMILMARAAIELKKEPYAIAASVIQMNAKKTDLFTPCETGAKQT